MTEQQQSGLVLALGFFDGVHLGHQALIQKAMDKAAEYGCESGVMTFEKHPLTEIFPRYTPFLIMNNKQKEEKMRSLGVQHVYIEPFTDTLMKLSPEEFVRDFLLAKYKLKGLVVGFNYSFGYKGEGKADDLERLGKKYGFSVDVVKPCLHDGAPVSSTVIRDLLGLGRVEEAAELLGNPYSITGPVQEGKKLGRQYKIPTANLKLNPKELLPANGVYFTRVHVDGKTYDGLTNLGYNPTFEKHPYSVETYIYDFHDNIYGKELTLEFIKFIRGEMKFNSLDELFEQIHADIRRANTLYRKKTRVNKV